MLALLVLLAAAQAQQTGFDAHGLSLVPSDGDPTDPLVTWTPEAQVPGSISLTGVTELADKPLVVPFPDGFGVEYREVIGDWMGTHVGVHAGLHERVALAATLPLWLTTDGPNGRSGPAAGDLRLHAPVALVPMRPRWGGQSLGLSVAPFLDVPTGHAGRLVGSPRTGAGALGVLGVSAGRVQVAANAGFEVTGDAAYAVLGNGQRVLAALAGSYRVHDLVGVHLEASLRPALGGHDVLFAGIPGEVVGSVRGRGRQGMHWLVGGSLPLTHGATAAAGRVFAGLGWTWSKPALADGDGDGVADTRDACPSETETWNRHDDTDGCPDRLSRVRVVVRDPSGRPVVGARVVVDGWERGRTDATGAFLLEPRRPGTPLTLSLREGVGYQAEPVAIELPEGEVTSALTLASP